MLQLHLRMFYYNMFSLVHNDYYGAEGYSYKLCSELPLGQHAHIVISSTNSKMHLQACPVNSFILSHYYFQFI